MGRGFVELVGDAGRQFDAQPERRTRFLQRVHIFASGTGSYLLGLQAGYDHMSPRAGSSASWPTFRFRVFPRYIGGTATLATPADRHSRIMLDRVEFFGSLRGRVGYAPNFGNGNWLFYATGGLAMELRSIYPHATRRRPGWRHRGAGND